MITGLSPLDTLAARTIANRTKAEGAASSEKAAPVNVSKPNSASALKPFSEVALDARAALNAGYEKLGKVANDQTTASEWFDTVGLANLDRRTLYAIASNQGGMFSETEISAAQSTMADRHSQAIHGFGKSTADIFKASVDYLDAAPLRKKHHSNGHTQEHPLSGGMSRKCGTKVGCRKM
ncbi:MAG: hypothetical protein ACFCUR_04730 [Rhodomicrobiaceae bacterium]